MERQYAGGEDQVMRSKINLDNMVDLVSKGKVEKVLDMIDSKPVADATASEMIKMPKQLVFAGNHREYVEYLKKHNISSNFAIYMVDEHLVHKNVMLCEQNNEQFDIVLVGTWFLEDWRVNMLRKYYQKAANIIGG